MHMFQSDHGPVNPKFIFIAKCGVTDISMIDFDLAK